jgi:predicted RNA-binding protein
MNIYTSKEENTWVSMNFIQLSKEQMDLLPKRKETTQPLTQEALELLDYINQNRWTTIEGIKKDQLISFYNNLISEIPEEDYQLISIDINEKIDGVFKGILNYRLKDEHKQIRF